MEVIEENSFSADVMKTNVIEENTVIDAESNVGQKSNGVECEITSDAEHVELNEATTAVPSTQIDDNKPDSTSIPEDCPADTHESIGVAETTVECNNLTVDEPVPVTDTEIPLKSHDIEAKTDIQTEMSCETHGVELETDADNTLSDNVEKETIKEHEIFTETAGEISTTETIVSTTNEEVQFETEILVEENDNDFNENVVEEIQENVCTNNILSELGPNIELSEVLRSSDVAENIENNNGAMKQEVFNKEELLDILEGNDMQYSVVGLPKLSPEKESQKALQQLHRLKEEKGRRKYKRNSYTAKVRRADKKVESSTEKTEIIQGSQTPQVNTSQGETENITDGIQQSKNIVKVLVMDWEDDEHLDENDTSKVTEGETLLKDAEPLIKAQEELSKDEIPERNSIDSSTSEDQIQKQSKSGDEGAPRRQSRVIKKKVIFDPDNPDTFTKTKTSTKTKDKDKETSPLKEHPTSSKKIKVETTTQRSKSKSPLSKLQWKKPSPKNIKQCKRLTEVDRLLMDEGAVNMIYQLTPEAPKGKKNMRTKAEFIKKIQSSTPDTKEMKFRERKKESKYEEGEAKRILSGKQRGSLSSSVKSPAISEDFETHSADDSIIYRRHSSSSYSSSCMSPRRLSDVEAGNVQTSTRPSQHLTSSESNNASKSLINFESDNKIGIEESKSLSNSKGEIINRDDCLSLKEKLNSKLSLALKKRKREFTKIEKPIKQKKTTAPEELVSNNESFIQLKFVCCAIEIDHRLATICIQKTGLKFSVEVLQDLEEALKYIQSRQDISTTLLTSECVTMCSSLDLTQLLDENKAVKPKNAYELAESIVSLLSTLSRHSKLVCCGARGVCSGLALALVALCDVALAAEDCTFTLVSPLMLPATAVLTAQCRALPQALVNDLVLFGRRLSASEALRGGLTSRTLWPDKFDEQVQNIAKDIATQPLQSILLKKKLLNVKKDTNAEQTFLSCLEAERDLLVEYWTSVEGQELLRASLEGTPAAPSASPQ